MNIWKMKYLYCKEINEDMIDHCSYVHNLGSCEIKAWKKFRPKRDLNPRPLQTISDIFFSCHLEKFWPKGFIISRFLKPKYVIMMWALNFWLTGTRVFPLLMSSFWSVFQNWWKEAVTLSNKLMLCGILENSLNNALLILQSPLYVISAAFSKCFPGAGYMNVGGGLGSEAGQAFKCP